eukprot:INCI17661.1.p1 GENE.INCI17661.1~~INCI17661.1.p1  ORF type:complete len:943 (-),score=154.05 INCI17661.1:1849-4677(-)
MFKLTEDGAANHRQKFLELQTLLQNCSLSLPWAFDIGQSVHIDLRNSAMTATATKAFRVKAQDALVSFTNRPLTFYLRSGLWTDVHPSLFCDIVVPSPSFSQATDKHLNDKHLSSTTPLDLAHNESFGGEQRLNMTFRKAKNANQSLLDSFLAIDSRMGTKMKANLFARAALEMGFGPDTFIQPIAGSAMNTIMVVLGQHFMGYFGSCISVRFNAFLTGWENDKGRPFVIIWAVMDAIRDIDKNMQKIKLKIEQIKAMIKLAIAIAKQKLKMIEAIALAVLAQIQAMMKAKLSLLLAIKAAVMAKMAVIAAAAALARAAMAAAMAAMQMAAQSAFAMAQMKLELGNLAATQDLTGQVRKLARQGSASASNASKSALSAAEASQMLAQNLTAVLDKGLDGSRQILSEMRRIYANFTNQTGLNATDSAVNSTTMDPLSGTGNQCAGQGSRWFETNSSTIAPIGEVLAWHPELQQQAYPPTKNHWASTLSGRHIVHQDAAVKLSPSMNTAASEIFSTFSSFLKISDASGEKGAETESHSDAEIAGLSRATEEATVTTHAAMALVMHQQIHEMETMVHKTSKTHAVLHDLSSKDLNVLWKVDGTNENGKDSATRALHLMQGSDDQYGFHSKLDLGSFHLGPREDEGTAAWMKRVYSDVLALETHTKQTLTGLLRSLRLYTPNTTVWPTTVEEGLLMLRSKSELASPGHVAEELQSFVEVELGVSALDLGKVTLAQLPDPSPNGLQMPLFRDMALSMMEQAGGLTKLYSKLLAVNLVGTLAAPLSITLSDLLEEQTTSPVVAHVRQVLRSEETSGSEGPGSLSEDVLEAVAKSVSGTVGFAVSENMLRILPAYLTTSLHHVLTATATRAVVHALAPTLMHTLVFPEADAADRHCFQCARFGKGCSMCPRWQSEWRKLKESYYYLNFYADYFSDYFSQVYSSTEFSVH